MKNKNLIIGVIVVLVLAVVVVFAVYTNNKDNSNSKEENKESEVATKEEKAIDNNENYFIIINGEKFNVGDKFSELSKVNLKQDSRVLNEKVAKNTYMIGAGSIYNSNDKIVCNMTPYNPTDSTITIAESVIGGVKIGEYQYDKISEDVLSLNIEVCGGLKLGASYDDVKNIFGETDDTYTAEKLGYTTYTYKSEEIYRNYEFTIDKDGKLSQIRWQNLVYNNK